jgi:hypothetical protein
MHAGMSVLCRVGRDLDVASKDLPSTECTVAHRHVQVSGTYVCSELAAEPESVVGITG